MSNKVEVTLPDGTVMREIHKGTRESNWHNSDGSITKKNTSYNLSVELTKKIEDKYRRERGADPLKWTSDYTDEFILYCKERGHIFMDESDPRPLDQQEIVEGFINTISIECDFVFISSSNANVGYVSEMRFNLFHNEDERKELHDMVKEFNRVNANSHPFISAEFGEKSTDTCSHLSFWWSRNRR